MKRFKLKFTVILILVGTVFIFTQCTKDDQVLDTPAAVNGNELFSQFTSAAPNIDGTIDAAWDNAEKLQITPTVPDAGNGLFTGYIGQQYPATLRSMYDDQNIYFLLEYTDASLNNNVAPWYFNPALNVTGKTGWQKEPTSKTYDGSGVLTREGWGEDKIAMLWNIDNSTPKFLAQTCYASCHVFTPYLDYSLTPAAMVSNSASGNHYTNGPNEKIDMWWARLGYMSKDASLNLMDDNYQDYAGGQAITNLTGGNANGRHVDGIVPDGTKSTTWPFRPNYTVSPAQGEVNNSQNLKLDGTGATVAVPIWVKPGSNTNFILIADTVSGAAKKVTNVSSAGVLTLSDASTIDPTSGTDYQRTGNPATGPTAAKSIAAYIAVPLIGGRADITGSAVYTGSGWVVEFKRSIKTSDVLNQDVDFTGLEDHPFGVAIWNSSNYQHGINPNLVLKFKK
jgi:hypothetical protein